MGCTQSVSHPKLLPRTLQQVARIERGRSLLGVLENTGFLLAVYDPLLGIPQLGNTISREILIEFSHF